MKNGRNNKVFDFIALSFLAIHIIFLLLNWHNYPTELDTPYHLLMGKMFADNGKVMLWDSYSFAPVGRPHLYPPLEHIIIWLLHFITKACFMNVGRIIVILQSSLGLFFVWFISRKFFNPGVGLFSLIFFASNTENWWWQTSVVPIAIISMLFLPFILLYYRKRIIPSILILTSCLFLHYGLSLILISSVFLASIFSSEYRKKYLKSFFIITGASIALFSPWLFHIYKFRYYVFRHAKNLGNLPFLSLDILWPEILLSLNFLLWVFLVGGLIYCYKKMRLDFKYCLFFMSFISYLSFLFIFQGVRFNSHPAIVTSIIAGLGFHLGLNSCKKMKSKLKGLVRIFLVVLIFFSIFFEFHYLTAQLLKTNQIHIYYMGLDTNEVFFRPTPLLNEIKSFLLSHPLKGKHKLRLQDFFAHKQSALLLNYINNNIAEHEIIHISNAALASYITLETERKTDTGMYWEVVSPEMMQVINKNRKRGFYISRDSYFRDLLPEDYLKQEKYPKIIKRIGQYYIGYL